MGIAVNMYGNEQNESHVWVYSSSADEFGFDWVGLKLKLSLEIYVTYRWFIELVSSSSSGHGLSQHLLFGRIQLYVVLDFLYTCQKSQINLARIYLMSHLMASQQRCDQK